MTEKNVILRDLLMQSLKQLPKPVYDADVLSAASSVLKDNLLELSQFTDWFKSTKSSFLAFLNA